jgi:site-specific DNA recombinase
MSTGLTDELSDGAIKKLRAFAALARSVTRQVDHARAYAEQRGWIVDDRAVFLDDGISGAEFAARPGFVRLMNTLKPKPTFQALIMSEESRLGREAIETAYALKQLITSGVPVFFYMENRERTLESPTDKLLLSVTAFADELEREKARQRTYDAMVRKAESGQVTGGRVFGYDNVEVFADGLDANGKPRRSHVDRKINDREAAIVRRIFELCAHGHGMKMIASTLNQERAVAAGAAWTPERVGAVVRAIRAVRGSGSRRSRLEQDEETESVGPKAAARPARERVDAAPRVGAEDRLGRSVERGSRATRRVSQDVSPRNLRTVVGTAPGGHDW